MEVSRIIAEIDLQISKLQQARAVLAGTTKATTKTPGRPRGRKIAVNAAAVAAPKKAPARKRKLSPEGRKRIADAMKKRWAERRKQSGK